MPRVTGGRGAYGRSGWFKSPWSAEWLTVNITAKEMVPVVLAIALWGEALKTLHIQVHSDNMAVVEVIKARTSRDSNMISILQQYMYCEWTALEPMPSHEIMLIFFCRSHLEYARRQWCLKSCGPSLSSWR